MPTIMVKVDLECSRCHAKIQKVLNRIQEKGEFCIDGIEYDEKNNRVIVKGPFDADKLTDKLCCKLCKIIKEIEIVEHRKGETKEEQKPPPPDSHKKVKSKPPPAETEVVVEVSYTWPSDCCCHHGHGGCHCCSCGKAPAPPQPQYILTPQYVPQPYPCGGGGGGGYRIVCEEDPAYACTIM